MRTLLGRRRGPVLGMLLVSLAVLLGFWIPAAAQYGSPNPQGKTESPTVEITIDSLSATTFNLGSDLTINFTVKLNGLTLDSANLEVRNSGGTLVVTQALDGTQRSEGSHAIVWTEGKWNNGAHNAAYANPKNSDYAIKIVGTCSAGTVSSNVKKAKTRLVVQADVRDQAPTGATPSKVAGLRKVGDALKVQLADGSGTSKATAAFTLSGTTAEEKRVVATFSSMTNVTGGSYTVIFRDLRDDIGNFTDDDNNGSNGVQPPSVLSLALH